MIMGHLGGDPEVKFTQNNVMMCKFSVATNARWRDNQGELQEKTTWHKVTTFGKMAETCSKCLFKGSKVYVEGPIEVNIYTPPNSDEKKYFYGITGLTVLFLGNPKDKDRVDSSNPFNEEELPGAPSDNDDLPF